jgi:two-component system nitrate/nitrite response regulator NarL
MVMKAGQQAIRILIVDGQTMFRQGLTLLFEEEPDFRVMADTDDADQVPRLVADCNPDILLVDLARLRSTSGNSGLELLHQLISAAPNVRPILMTSAIDAGGVLKALKTGIRGVLHKQSGIALCTKCIRTVMAGEYWINHGAISELIASFAGMSPQPGSNGKPAGFQFSKREEQILRVLIYGYSNKEIAKELDVSEQAVKYHMTRIFRKTGVSNRMELARLSISNELIEE